MGANAAFVRDPATLAWLAQFDPFEQPAMQAMLEAMLLVSRDDFPERLQTLVLQRIEAEPGCVGLFVEREVDGPRDAPDPLFRQASGPPKREPGPAPGARRGVRPARARRGAGCR